MFRTCRFKGTTDATCTTSWIQASRTQACRIRLAHQPHSCRAASTSANPYPFPKAAHPTPHQIFHLPRSATRADVKARYYDLVRIYHPDSPVASAGGISPETAHARFQAIASAYAVLSGKKPASSMDGSHAGEGPAAASRATYHDLSTAIWRARQMKRAELDVGMDERWKERMMLGVILLRTDHSASPDDWFVRLPNIYHALASALGSQKFSPVNCKERGFNGSGNKR